MALDTGGEGTMTIFSDNRGASLMTFQAMMVDVL
jgi:hypothetical protein